jgi:hypothetical protein
MKPLSDLNDDDLSAELHRSRGLRDAPESVIQRSIDLFGPRARATSAAPSLLQRVLAALDFDSAGMLLPAQGVRSTASSSRQMLFSAEGRDIDLRIVSADGSPSRDGGRWVIFGQLLGPDREGRVELSCADGVREVALDEMLEFRFDQVPGGSVRLALHLAGLVIELPPLDVPRPPVP